MNSRVDLVLQGSRDMGVYCAGLVGIDRPVVVAFQNYSVLLDLTKDEARDIMRKLKSFGIESKIQIQTDDFDPGRRFNAWQSS